MTAIIVLRRLMLLAGTAALMALGSTAPLLAHPTATSFVIVTVTGAEDATIEITTDAESLRLKLEALGDSDSRTLAPSSPRTFAPSSPRTLAPSSPRTFAPSHPRTLIDLMPVLLRHIALDADAGAVTLLPGSVTAVDGNDSRVRVSVRAVLPGAATSLTWHSSLFLGAYPALIRGGDPRAATDADAYEWLNGDEASRAHPLADLNARNHGWVRFIRIVALGFTHILPGGLDHVLFVCGLFLLAGGTRSLLLQISAFTVAHSVTLALAALGLVSVPSVIVEPLIALSIAYVAIENLTTTSLSRWRLAVVFGFGLLHGLGFAGALRDLGVSRPDLPATLLGFNVGVEFGQIAVVALAALVVRLLPFPAARRRQWVTIPASAAIAAMGIFWALQRTLLR